MDEVFRALADPTRRSLLDELFNEDGQTLTALEQRLPMTRYGVMKHLRMLESAGLITVRRRGREKLHFLNPVPIRLVHDRWVGKYAEPWVATLSHLKQTLETASAAKVFELYIKATPERLWDAITDDSTRRRYWFGIGVSSDWTPGSRLTATCPGTVSRLTPARSSKSIPHAGSYTASTRCGARRPATPGPRGWAGRSRRSAIPAG